MCAYKSCSYSCASCDTEATCGVRDEACQWSEEEELCVDRASASLIIDDGGGGGTTSNDNSMADNGNTGTASDNFENDLAKVAALMAVLGMFVAAVGMFVYRSRKKEGQAAIVDRVGNRKTWRSGQATTDGMQTYTSRSSRPLKSKNSSFFGKKKSNYGRRLRGAKSTKMDDDVGNMASFNSGTFYFYF